MIELQRVSKSFVDERGRSVDAVSDVSLQVARGETLCLIGTSGSGKTTLLKMINRLVEPTSGLVRVNGVDVEDVDVVRLRREIGYVIQAGGIFPHMSVAANVGLPCRLERWERARVRERVHELLDLVDLPPDEFGDRRPRELSGGQRQRVGVARALALDPPVLLLDEPFGALDPITRDQLRGDFRRLQQRVAKTAVLVTHDMREAFELGDRIALMDGGRVVQVGTEAEFRAHPANEFVARFLETHFGEAATP